MILKKEYSAPFFNTKYASCQILVIMVRIFSFSVFFLFVIQKMKTTRMHPTFIFYF